MKLKLKAKNIALGEQNMSNILLKITSVELFLKQLIRLYKKAFGK